MIGEVRLFELLKAKIGAQEAEAFITIMDSKIDEAKKTMRDDFAKKEDMYGVKAELIRLEGLIVSSTAKCKNELVMWMVSTAIGLLAAMTAMMKIMIENAFSHIH